MSELIFAIANLQKYFKDNLRRIEALFPKKIRKIEAIDYCWCKVACAGQCKYFLRWKM